ncbi:unnamed protein product [Citrullus colocynthis]|uniref:Uncharacterized protein n=1 Tax=Citrullus colocynthis TaxID=252529 RepID=A0ABP0YQV3_9ROSI
MIQLTSPLPENEGKDSSTKGQDSGYCEPNPLSRSTKICAVELPRFQSVQLCKINAKARKWLLCNRDNTVHIQARMVAINIFWEKFFLVSNSIATIFASDVPFVKGVTVPSHCPLLPNGGSALALELPFVDGSFTRIVDRISLVIRCDSDGVEEDVSILTQNQLRLAIASEDWEVKIEGKCEVDGAAEEGCGQQENSDCCLTTAHRLCFSV